MATIQERKNSDGTTGYRVIVRLKGHPKQTATFRRKTDAKKWAAATESAIREGRYFQKAEARKHTAADLIDRYLEDVIPQKRDARNQIRQLKWWRKEIGDYLLSDVTPALISEKRDLLRHEGKAPATTKRYMAPMSHAFNIAIREYEWASDNPFSKVSKPKEPRGRVRFLTDDEREQLLKECKKSKQPGLYLVVVLALSTGARQTELWSLKWDQISLERESIILHDTKNGERRTLPLKGHALDQMKEWFTSRDESTPLVFPSRRDPMKPMDFRKAFELARDRVKLDDFRWHDLRHSAASYLAMNGASPSAIAEILGHKTLSMVKRYAHLSESYSAQVVDAMNAMIFKKSYDENGDQANLDIQKAP